MVCGNSGFEIRLRGRVNQGIEVFQNCIDNRLKIFGGQDQAEIIIGNQLIGYFTHWSFNCA